MGCDIHCYVEVADEKGKWYKTGGFISDAYNPKSKYFSTEEYKNADQILDERNYDEFAILANVRNGYGFAGVDTGDAIKPISMPKGLPEDISEQVLLEAKQWGSDGHSHSYLTAKEIADYPADLITKTHRGWVTVDVYKQFKNGGSPYPYCGGVGGTNIIYAKNHQCEDIQEQNPEKTVYTQIEWKTTARESAPWLFDDGLSQLMSRSKNSFGTDVRIVFWFDN